MYSTDATHSGIAALSTGPNDQFFGLIDITNPFTFITFVSNSNLVQYGMDEFYYGQTAAVPEPASLLLLGSGLVGMAFFRRKFKV